MIPPEGKALVYVVRPNRAGGIIKFQFHVDGKHVGTTKARRFLYLVLDPGPHLFMSKSENESEMQLNLEAGKTYFLKQKIKLGALKTMNELIQVNESEGREILQNCRLGDQTEKPIIANTKPCINCGKQIAIDVKFCTHCSARQIEAEKSITANTKPCINCGKQIAIDTKFCTHCGASQIKAAEPITVNTKPCINCGKQIEIELKFCRHCGASQIETESKDITTKPKYPIPEIIHRIGVENLNLKKEFTCTDDQLRKNLYIGIVVFIISLISINILLAFPPQSGSPVTNWALGLGISIGLTLCGIVTIILYKIKPEKLRYLIERKRIITAKRKAKKIDKKMKKKQKSTKI